MQPGSKLFIIMLLLTLLYISMQIIIIYSYSVGNIEILPAYPNYLYSIDGPSTLANFAIQMVSVIAFVFLLLKMGNELISTSKKLSFTILILMLIVFFSTALIAGSPYIYNDDQYFPLYLTSISIYLSGGAIVAVPSALLLFILWKLLKKQLQLGISVDPKEIIADGKTKSTVTIQLLDSKMEPIAAEADIEVKITSTDGAIENSTVIIPKGKDMEKTSLTSSEKVGVAVLSADVKGLKTATAEVSFEEKKRYCMCCGAKFSVEKRCPVCGESPPSASDTFKCANCGELLPLSVKTRFCSECGAKQPGREGG